jgi:hypothetical protein
MTNKIKAEMKLQLATRAIILRPSFCALCSIETELNESLVEYLANIDQNLPKLTHLKLIIEHSARAYSNCQVKDLDIGEEIIKRGYYEVLRNVITFLKNSLQI